MSDGAPLRVCIDARIPDGPASGARAVVMGLAQALAQLEGEGEQYLFLASRHSHSWLLPHMQGACTLLLDHSQASSALRRALAAVPGARWLAGRVRGHRVATAGVPASDGTIEAAGVDVVHFLQPNAFATTVRNIYQIHDLQHRHLPQLMRPQSVAERDRTYREFSRRADRVTVMTSWGREDAIAAYSLPPEKVCVVPWAPVFSTPQVPSEERLAATRAHLKLPAEFALYPAQTWPHKNHGTLLQALAHLRGTHGLRIPLVCCGRQDEHFAQLQRAVEQLRLQDQVIFTGYVAPDDLACLYHLARCMVFPSLFEGWGLPLMEAAEAGLPMACSRISPLQELVGDAAILFDPHLAESIAAALQSLWLDSDLRLQLVASGHRRVAEFSWQRTARRFRAHYRDVAGHVLSEEDRLLLAEPPRV